MASQDYYYNLLKKQGSAALNSANATVTQNANKQSEIINSQYDTNDQLIKEQYETNIADTEESYESELKRNEVQRVLNERQIERRMAENGLTDSGLNRTQSTAVQLSYANQKGNLIKQRQKAVDTLAATMNSQLLASKTNRNAALAEIELNRNNAIAENNATYESSWQSQAADLAKADVDAENDAIEKRYAAQDALMAKLNDAGLSDEAKQQYIDVFVSRYPLSTDTYDFYKSIGQEKLFYADWGSNEWSSFFRKLHDTDGRERAAAIYQEFKEKGYLPAKYYKDAGEAAVHGW